MELLNGRPANEAGRLEKEIRVYDLLDSLGISYQRVDHEPAMTIDACQNIDKLMGTHMCKNLFLCNRQETDFYLLLMPGDKKFKTKELSSQINTARLSFANETHMEELLNITPGSVSVMGLMNDKENQVQLLIDEDLLAHPYLGCHPCINTSSLCVKMDDILHTFLSAVHHEPRYVKLLGE